MQLAKGCSTHLRRSCEHSRLIQDNKTEFTNPVSLPFSGDMRVSRGDAGTVHDGCNVVVIVSQKLGKDCSWDERWPCIRVALRSRIRYHRTLMKPLL